MSSQYNRINGTLLVSPKELKMLSFDRFDYQAQKANSTHYTSTIEDNYSDQTLKFITKTLTSVNAWDEALAVELFNLALIMVENQQKRVCGRLLSIILMNSSSSTVCSFISERVDAIVEILERTNRDESKSDADATNILNSFMIMNGLYQNARRADCRNSS